MNEHSKHTAKKIIETIDLPQDIFFGLPNLSLSGNQELYISNHRGILMFSPEEIHILSEKNQIQVKGRGLNIFSYSKDELIIKGFISSIGFV